VFKLSPFFADDQYGSRVMKTQIFRIFLLDTLVIIGLVILAAFALNQMKLELLIGFMIGLMAMSYLAIFKEGIQSISEALGLLAIVFGLALSFLIVDLQHNGTLLSLGVQLFAMAVLILISMVLVKQNIENEIPTNN